ncbi:activated Cdc42 kinase-like isoform X1 [Procambarus clarkii]|uniref:activated Cdc42 kinase-like isoform X1 n=1 Tax=Procambarus clarkii TaxID=6728 RepID=UPI001E676D29|nr:activated Cdc42 kinase-like isoform X1 [Procambarus clarkii]XP_045605755.1 activated Cdc42 kinase-like isoform X1 [Procambarus clarkii]XP_045605764.1 activated Cdc42 kinase-like isoform X1 [Procambarus clarkii]XP_045605773.1 activated Cdc42 kinase-like isoform X1 [Procambarus clarkii]
MTSIQRGPGLYEFLTEAELQHYFNNFKNILKVQNVGQIKFVADEDLQAMGMSRPEIRRLKKFFHKYCPQTYLSKFKKILLTRKDGLDSPEVVVPDDVGERPSVRVPSKHIIPADAIVINKELGVGEFGVVQQGVWTNEEGERIQVAIKCLSKERMQTQPMEFLKEAAIMHTIDSEHIVRLYGVVLDTNALMLVTELAPLRSLLECIKEPSLRVSFPVTSLCHFSIQICDGMSYLEAKRLIHRDLAARNILVFSKNKIKISDFGLSRALGVGKDYYQTNFNVNLKLPIAWCAPECINYLRFTSASDVWAFGVTLWEMFSYGFQPWAALTGQQILEAIDEPNFQRLEQPEACPKEYYTIMLKCWQHDPAKRPKFVDLMNILPDCKPEQVQVVRECEDPPATPGGKRDRLQYSVGDVITVLDKRPMPDNPSVWKGVLNTGKTGHFNPANTVTYLGTNIPSNKSSFQRGDGKNPYSSRRRLRPEMISGPQGDFKHTGHVGLDGAYFGDVSFLGDKVQDGRFVQKKLDKYHQLPKQIVAPYKPSDDHDQSTSLTRASSDVSDRAPLLKKVGDKGKSGPAAEHNWSDTASEDQPDSPTRSRQTDHEYHEISDEEEPLPKPFRSSSFDLGPSLMDEVFRALGGSASSGPSSLEPPGSLPPLSPTQQSQALLEDNESHNVKNEIKEMASKFSNKDSSKKKQAMVKPISAADQRTLDSAIAMANELASKSMLELDCNHESSADSEGAPDSPITPSSPTKHGGSRFSFKFSSKGSPKPERRHFSAEAASIPDIQSSISEEAKEVYNSLVERPGLDCEPLAYRSDPEPPISEPEPAEHNPLRMLRAGVTVRPKIRGNKHNFSSGFSTIERSHGMRAGTREGLTTTPNSNTADLTTHQTLPKGFKHSKVPPPVKPKPSPLVIPNSAFRATNESAGESSTTPDTISPDGSNQDAINLLPLPPRDRTRAVASLTKPRHQRKHPLIIPGGVTNSLLRGGGHVPALGSLSDKVEHTSSRLVIQHTHNPQLESHSTTASTTPSGSPAADGFVSDESTTSPGPRLPPAKPPRLFTSPSALDDSFESQVASEMDALDDILEEEQSVSPVGPLPPLFPNPESFTNSSDHVTTNGFGEGPGGGSGSLYQSGDHVSCEDLLDFAMDRPNSRRTQGPARGTQSDEVHIMQKVLKNEHVSPEECVVALNECEWDVHRALKLIRLQLLLPAHRVPIEAARHTLASFSWDVSKAASYLVATRGISEDTAQV